MRWALTTCVATWGTGARRRARTLLRSCARLSRSGSGDDNLVKAIAGGIKLETLDQALSSAAEVIIVGAGICAQDDRVSTASKVRAAIDAYNAEA